MSRLAVFPAVYPKIGKVGFSVGWLNDNNYCFVWGNFKTREKANEILKKEYPDSEIINYENHTDCYHRHNNLPHSGEGR